MLTDDMLRQAAAESSTAFVRAVEQDYDDNRQYSPSHQFEKKMNRLTRRANHPNLYHSAQRVASVVLAILLAGSAWLTVDVQAREAFFGWVKETYETFFIYRFTDESNELSSSAETSTYYPNWLPNGYIEQQTIDVGGTVSVYFRNDIGQLMDFSYTQTATNIDWFIDTTDMAQQEVNVGAFAADLFLSSTDDIANIIMWTSDNQTAFFISAFLPQEELILMAENISKK